MRAWFDTIADHLAARMGPDEGFTLHLAGEESDFARLNGGRVRQPGSVTQCNATVRLLHNGRHASVVVGLSGAADADRAEVDGALKHLRGLLPHLPADPHLLVATEVDSSEDVRDSALPDATEMVSALLSQATDLDLVGIAASGTLFRGFANHLGQRNWFSRASFNLDWCLMHVEDKGVKASLAGFEFDPGALSVEMSRAREQLSVLARPPRSIEPGGYRAWLSPSALESLMGPLFYGGFSMKQCESGSSPLRRFYTGDDQLSELVHLSEDIAGGISPSFQGDGFRTPDRVPLFEAGRMVGALANPRTGQEFDRPHNGADANELPQSLSLATGSLPQDDVLDAIGTGLYIGNLWYTNLSDRAACRITGMTRFATLWVEDGEVVAPVPVMRFDDTLSRMLGTELEALGAEADFRPSSDTYFERSTRSSRLPGALLRDLRFTL